MPRLIFLWPLSPVFMAFILRINMWVVWEPAPYHLYRVSKKMLWIQMQKNTAAEWKPIEILQHVSVNVIVQITKNSSELFYHIAPTPFLQSQDYWFCYDVSKRYRFVVQSESECLVIWVISEREASTVKYKGFFFIKKAYPRTTLDACTLWNICSVLHRSAAFVEHGAAPLDSCSHST